MKNKTQNKPPKFSQWLMQKLFPDKGNHSITGDMFEQFIFMSETDGPRNAKWWYRKELLKSIVPFLFSNIYWGKSMLNNYLKISWRNIVKYKSHSAITFSSLILSLTVFFLIASYVLYETSYDRFFENSDRIYRVSIERKYPKLTNYFAFIGPGVGPAIKNDLPGVEEFVRIRKREGIIKYADKIFKQDNLLCVDSTFLKVFSINLIKGSKANVLNLPLSAIISTSFAKKLFGNENPLGKIVTMNDSINVNIAGLAEDLPANSHFQFDLIISSFPEWNQMRSPLTTWGWFGFNTYLLLNKNASYKELDSKLDDLTAKYLRTEFGDSGFKEWIKNQNYYKHYLIPLTDIHLYSNITGELGINGDIGKVYFFSVIALFVLFIGCANFVNIITARFSSRAKEVGVRKVLGSRRSNLITQFMGESILMVILSVIISTILVAVLIPFFNASLGKQIELSGLITPAVGALFVIFTFGLGIISGLYPAMFLSSFSPTVIFRGKITKGIKSSGLRNLLVITQFCLTIILIVGTLVVYNQMNFIINKGLGFDKENLIVINNANILQNEKEVFKEELLNNPNIKSAVFSTGLPSFVNSPATYRLSLAEENDNINMKTVWTDNDFIKTYGLEIIYGRDLRQSDISNEQRYAVVNESAANKLGWNEEAIGKEIYIIDGTRLTIVGILKDFNFESLHENIQPVVLIATNPATVRTNFLSVRVSGENINETLGFVENKWKEFVNDTEFNFNFLDERITLLYENEQQTLKLFLVFSAISIFVACLGLFGLTSFAAEQRTKEIGIRKVLGATTTNIFLNLVRQFTKWVVMSNIIAIPLAYYVMNGWLQGFAYRIDLDAWTFVLAGTIAVFVAAGTVSYQAIKSAIANPVSSLRYE